MIDVCLHNGAYYTPAGWSGLDQPTCAANAGQWLQISTDVTLETLFQTYFAFNVELFSYIIGATIVTYAIGYGTGLIARLMTGPKHPGDF